MFCKYCGKQISDDAKFCDGCGKKLTQESSSEPRRCPKCGEIVPQYAQACKYCGHDLAAQKPAKAKKRKPMGCLVWVLVVLLVIGGCSAMLGGNDDSSTEPTSAAPSIETETSRTEAEEVIPLDTAAANAEAIIKEQFDNCTVSYDDTGFTATISVDGVSMIGTLAAGGNEEMQETWKKIVDSTVSMSGSMTRYFRECGFDDYVVSVNVVNDQNQDNIVIMTMNGTLVYDAVTNKE